MNKNGFWDYLIEQAQEELYTELNRDATDEEVEQRAKFIMDNSVPDYDAMGKDLELDS